MKSFRVTIVALVFLAICHRVSAKELLNAGSQAPKLEIAHWVTNGGDKLPEVHEFESGRVYVVEFWATWCGPCIASMPHLAELQTKYGESSLQIISVAHESKESVVEFLQRPFGDKHDSKTYADVCGQYCLTTDPDESVYKSYMFAAFQFSIPTAFIVGKSGLIEWIGQPDAMDKPLEAVLNDSWDRSDFSESYAKEKRVIWTTQAVNRTFKRKGFEAAFSLLNGLIAQVENESKAELLPVRLGLLLRCKPEMGLDELPGMLASADFDLFTSCAINITLARMKENSSMKTQFVDLLVQHHAAALETAQDAKSRGFLLDKVAASLTAVKRYDEAIVFQQRAIDASTGKQAEYYERLLAQLKRVQKAEVDRATQDREKQEDP